MKYKPTIFGLKLLYIFVKIGIYEKMHITYFDRLLLVLFFLKLNLYWVYLIL
jgi:hypothetical protein